MLHYQARKYVGRAMNIKTEHINECITELKNALTKEDIDLKLDMIIMFSEHITGIAKKLKEFNNEEIEE